jgi:Fe2+ transport system protein B
MADSLLKSLLVDGIIAGVGGMVIFLPQILILFLSILLLEDFGYMARAAFLMDRLMSVVGLNGCAFSSCCPASPAPFPTSWRRVPSPIRWIGWSRF